MSNHTVKPITVPRSERDRHEKGTAMSLIAADNKASVAKSARLKALRMERDASEAAAVAAAPAPAKKAALKKPAARRVRKTA